MSRPSVRSFALRAAGCALTALVAWRIVGPAGLAVSSVLFGVVLAGPLIELGSDAFHWLRDRAYADVEGRHYAYRGTSIRVIEDDGHQRWIRLADLRAVLGAGASEGALARLYGAHLRRFGWRRQAYLSAETLARHLSRDTRSAAGRFLMWLERDVVKPARVLQDRHATCPAPLGDPTTRTPPP